MRNISLIILGTSMFNYSMINAQCKNISDDEYYTTYLPYDRNDPDLYDKAVKKLQKNISLSIDYSSTKISSSETRGRRFRSKNRAESNAYASSYGRINDAKKDTCNNYYIIYKNKQDYHNEQKEYFMKMLKVYFNSISDLLSQGTITDMKTLKEKVPEYNKKRDELYLIYPLVTLSNFEEDILNDFSKQVNSLSKMETDVRLNRKRNLNNLGNKFKKGLSKVANGIVDLGESLNQ